MVEDPGGKWELARQAQGPEVESEGDDGVALGQRRELEPGSAGRGGGGAWETQHLPSHPPAPGVQDRGHSGLAHTWTDPGLQQEAG